MSDIMFEKANRMKLRFDTPKGQLSAEDLWDLPLTSPTGKANLDDIAKDLFRQLKDDGNVSFVQPSVTTDKTIQMKFDIVKYVIDVRVAERDAAEIARKNKEKKQLILGIIAQKENDVLSNASLEELRGMVESM
jgi:hypothetical protein